MFLGDTEKEHWFDVGQCKGSLKLFNKTGLQNFRNNADYMNNKKDNSGHYSVTTFCSLQSSKNTLETLEVKSVFLS